MYFFLSPLLLYPSKIISHVVFLSVRIMTKCLFSDTKIDENKGFVDSKIGEACIIRLPFIVA